MGQGTAINFYENLVNTYLTEEAAPSAEITDNDLLEDITCLALNMLPARYIRHKVDMAFFLSDEEHRQMKAAVTLAVDNAIKNVIENSRETSLA